MSDYDSPWKEALDRFFLPFLAFFFPNIEVEIDWMRGYETLDKELQQVVREAEVRRRLADKLFKVWRKDGSEAWVLIHVEIQTGPEEEFPERMFVYNYRLFDRYRRTVVSLAVLGDDRPNWRPNQFGYALWGCRVQFEFPTVKLLDYANDEAALENNPNPFAAIALAHLKTLQTRQDPEERRRWKLRVVKSLFERGFGATDIRQLFRLIDWMMDLPAELARQFTDDLRRYEEERQMPYITSVERIALEEGIAKGMTKGMAEGMALGKAEGKAEGLREGLLESIALSLQLRFAPDGILLLPKIRQIQDTGALKAILERLLTASSLHEVEREIR